MDLIEHEKFHPIPVKGGLVEELTKDRKRQSIVSKPLCTLIIESLAFYPDREH